MRVADAVGRGLAGLGVNTVFGVVGSGNFHVTNALVAGGVKFRTNQAPIKKAPHGVVALVISYTDKVNIMSEACHKVTPRRNGGDFDERNTGLHHDRPQ